MKRWEQDMPKKLRLTLPGKTVQSHLNMRQVVIFAQNDVNHGGS